MKVILGYKMNRESNKIVYPIYKYCSIDSGKLILKNNTLKFSNPSTFNDPFEFTPSLIDSTPDHADIKNLVEKLEFSNRIEKRRFYQKALKNQNNIGPLLNSVLKETKSKVKVCCFSGLNDNNLMWSHYGNYHKGICMGFNNIPVNADIKIMDYVKYTPKIEPVNYFKNEHLSILNWILSKSNDWEYEQEIRFVSESQHVNEDLSEEFIQLNKESLVKIIFGCRTTNQDIEEIKQLINVGGYPNVTFSKMIESKTDFKLIETLL